MNRIYVRDLVCYQNEDQKQRQAALKRFSPDNYFDLDLLPTEGLKAELGNYIHFRGEHLKLGSIRSEFWPYHVFCSFLREEYPELESLLDEKSLHMRRSLKKMDAEEWI